MSATIIDLFRSRKKNSPLVKAKVQAQPRPVSEANANLNLNLEWLVAPDKRYVKFPTSFLDFLRTADITVQQTKMLVTAVRHCHGFHKPDRSFDRVDLRHWLGWDRRSIARAAEELVERQIFRFAAPKADATAHQSSYKYRVCNDTSKWNPAWKTRPVDKSVDNPVDNSKIVEQLRLLGENLRTAEPPKADSRVRPSGSYPQPPIYKEGEGNPAEEQQNVSREAPNLLDMAGLLKKSLKKYKESPENFDQRKRKNEIFKEMAATRLWTDQELLELAATKSAEELEALYAERKAG